MLRFGRERCPATHNSTRAGVPFPTMVSKLSGTSSTTLDACTPAQSAATTRESGSFMVPAKVQYVSLMS